MHRKVSELQQILGQAAKDDVERIMADGSILMLSQPVSASHKGFGLKIVGKPCEGKPHARFDEGRLGKSADCTSLLLYKEEI